VNYSGCVGPSLADTQTAPSGSPIILGFLVMDFLLTLLLSQTESNAEWEEFKAVIDNGLEHF
jgi:hypothetical protein